MNKYENISISTALNEALNESIDWNNEEAEWDRLSSEFDSNFDYYGSKLIDIKTEETIGEIWDDSTIVLYNPEKYKDKIELLGDWSGCQYGSGEVLDKDENLLYSSRNLRNEALNES